MWSTCMFLAWELLVSSLIIITTLSFGKPLPPTFELLEGDIIPDKKTGPQNVIDKSSKKWPEAVVPYVIDDSVSVAEQDILDHVITFLVLNTCIWLQPRDNEDNYIVFVGQVEGCSSFVGMQGGPQVIGLGPHCYDQVGLVFHEIMHAVGFYHEHNRPDRDNFVTVIWDNIEPGYRYAFNVRNNSLTLGLAYDYDSVLHYNAWEFSASGRQTIIPLYVSPARIGQRWEMSHMDIKKLNEFYKSDCELRTNRVKKLG